MVTVSIYFLVGLVLVLKSADWLVDGATAIARRLGISNLVIGLTLVAFGTSAPEMAVTLLSNARDASNIAIGNILGSNIANILLILGISALITPLLLRRETIWQQVPLGLTGVILVGVLANSGGSLSVGDGLILLAIFTAFIYRVFTQARSGVNGFAISHLPSDSSATKSVMFVIIGLVGLVFGGQLVVDHAITLAELLGVSRSLIALTLIAVGTSLPELATSVVAAYKKNADIAVGNIVGSNIFNIFWILGLSAALKPIPFAGENNFDLSVATLASALLFVFMFIGKRHILERWQGGFFLVSYVVYVATLIYNG